MLFVWMWIDEICEILILDNNSQQWKQIHSLQRSNDSSFQIADIECYPANTRSAKIDSPKRSVRKIGFYQIAAFEGDGRETTIIETAVSEMAVRDAYLIHFAHCQIDVSGVAVMQQNMIHSRLREIGSQ